MTRFFLLIPVLSMVVAPARAQSSSPLGDPTTRSFLIQLGVGDTEARSWDGSIAVKGGRLVQLRNWLPRPGQKVAGSSWKLGVEQGENIGWRANMQPPPEDKPRFFWRPAVVADIVGGGARISVSTANGEFSFRASDIQVGRAARFLDGAVTVELAAATEKISEEGPENDFVAALSGADGEVWVCWVAYSYQDKASRVLARRFDGKAWGAIQTVSERPGDIYLAKLGRDGKGRPWAVWSEQREGDFELYGRAWGEGSWLAVERLTSEKGNDIFPNLATDSSGGMWLVWQANRGGAFEILARRHKDGAWGPAQKVSTSAANDWEPVIAADGRGAVHVGWDTYDKGDYDVVLRTWRDGKWSAVTSIAATPRYEAHVTLAVDGDDRLWAAWNESGTNWGKDTGWVLNMEGTQIYQSRTIEVAAYDGSGWSRPAADINAALPHEPRGFVDFPKIYLGGDGRMWVAYRNRTLRLRDNPNNYHAHRAAWETWATALDGGRWTDPLAIPSTRGRQDVRWEPASNGKGEVLAAWPTDNRDSEEFLFEQADVYAGRMPKLAGAAPAPQMVQRREAEVAYFPFHANDAADVKRIRDYVIESGGKRYQIYRGDTHRHSEFSMDGNNDGSLTQSYRYAIDAAELEYLLMSEHNQTGGPDLEYINWLLQQMVDVMTLPGKFVPYYGFERSTRYPNGHRNVLFTKRGNPTLPMPEDERYGRVVGGDLLYDYLRRYDGICIPHTSATSMGTDWSFNDPELEPLVEIYQGDRISSEYEGAPRAAVTGNLYTQPGLFEPAGYVWNAWAKGYKIGVQAASDHVSTHISYAATIAEEFTREGMIDAMKKRHSYGATDNIILDYRMQAGGQEYLQGDAVTVDGDFALSVKIAGTAPVRQIDIIKNQSFLHNRQNLGQEVTFTFKDNDVGSGENLYYVRVIQQDGQMAWSSPIWVTKR